MRNSRRFFPALVASLALLGAESAQAQLFVAEPASEPSAIEPPAIEHAELAYAMGAGPPVTWLSLRATRGPVAIVAALPAGASARAGLDAWLSALEVSGSVSVLPPSGAERCLEGARLARVTWPRERATAPSELALEAPDDVTTALAELGLATPAPLPEAASYVVWQFVEPDGAQTTRTLRVEGAALTFFAGGRFPVLVSALTRGAHAYPGEAAASELDLTFTPGKRPSSDYREQLWRSLARGGGPLLEMRARGPLFDWSIYEDTLTSAPLVQSYAERAMNELGAGDAKACAKQLAAFRDQERPDSSACGEALDAALAFTATGPELATLARFAMTSEGGVDPSVFVGGGELAAPLVRAHWLAEAPCAMAPLPPIVLDPPSSGPPPRPTLVPVTEAEVIVEHDHIDAEVSCWGEPGASDGYYSDTGDDVDCSSDTSSSAETDDSCASDTSSTAETDDSCASDTSSTSGDSAEIDCSSDTSSTAETDDSCASDTSSTSDHTDSGCSSDTSTSSDDTGYDGDTCTGTAAPKAERPGQQRAHLGAEPRGKRKRGKRVKTSLWSIGFAAFALPIRRRKRGPARTG